ncbi:hypothetical protein [Microbacterium sp. NIBRBAC000506063]|uniref:hypothetical protein n=1 Tax=Microbacterium sp. NIBRBAC000506063 TaxID=2734618 RepID=UPI001CB71B87|nr:hypothetical protein [Microbacterium sp. NIBRBAC000506063]
MSPFLAVVLATVLFFALAIMGLGALSYYTDTDVIAVPGLGQAPGVLAMGAAVAAFSGTLWTTVRPARPSFTPVLITALATPLAHLFVLWLVLLVTGSGLLVATTVAGDLVRGGFSLVLLLAAAVAAWGGVALRRTRSTGPQWPWERRADDED